MGVANDRRSVRYPGVLRWLVVLGAALIAVGYRHRRSAVMAEAPEATTRADSQPRANPQALPRSAKGLALQIWQNIGDHRVIALAAGITYYSLLAIFPAIAALVSIYGLFADPATIATELNSASDILPGGAISVIGDQLTRVASQDSRALGLTFLVGLGVSLWSANAGIKSLFDALNIVYGEREKRSFIVLNAVSLAFTVGIILFVLAALATMVVLPSALDYLGASEFGALILKIGRWPVLLVLVALAIALLYRFGASRQKVRWRWITWGSAVASVLWIAGSLLFSWYAANFGSFNKTYGSLGAVIGFMTWIWLSAIVILIGAEIDAVMEGLTPEQRGTQAMPVKR
jgi:membrane protein